MYEQAFRNRWPMDDDKRSEVLRVAMEIMTTSDKERNKIAAARLLMAAEAQNQSDQHKAVDVGVATRHDRVLAIASDLGIDPALIEDATAEAGSSVAGSAVESDTDSD